MDPYNPYAPPIFPSTPQIDDRRQEELLRDKKGRVVGTAFPGMLGAQSMEQVSPRAYVPQHQTPGSELYSPQPIEQTPSPYLRDMGGGYYAGDTEGNIPETPFGIKLGIRDIPRAAYEDKIRGINAPAPWGDPIKPERLRVSPPMRFADTPAPVFPPAPHLDAADAALKLTPQERALYQRHLDNLYGPGGVDNPDGSRSSMYQSVQEHNGKFYNVPTVWNGKREVEPWTNPRTGQTFDVPNATALKNIEAFGWGNFPAYATPEEADTRYDAMHGYMEKDTADYFKNRR